ncbi:polysaccharide deacetylase family protein [Sporosarcina sp. ACRSL]|uniref:polysaccharide deacetylase family protein n=1 Tax=Sporosarcina sp. ACRSL TaxID=2918215 RepID=UPI001EF68B46|nr:polysaccharide deacetylase family protein [Sporosarcina sp. ACRSL]MCG7345449.1 polysaccharide deacetylase family protein [Sporosarcina sp. ACRSL]
MSKQGAFVISLDFELNWGVHDVVSVEQYKENLLGVREAIPRMLELFHRFDIHATWATVGMLYCENKKELLDSLPSLQPNYENSNFSPYKKLKNIGENELNDPFHYAKSLIKIIETYSNQEMATHTFSHYYCLEEGQNEKSFEADLQAAMRIANSNGHVVKSLAFPRNQTNQSYLQVCKKYGIQCFRGNERSWLYRASRFHSEGIMKRALRLLDSYLNISGHNTYPISEVEIEPIVNLPSSRFLRPYMAKLKILEPMRLRRIKKSITHAARKGEVFHLWWHPHNFGKDIDENIQFLTEILQLVSKLRSEYGFESLSMAEASDIVLKMNRCHPHEKPPS